MKCKSLIAMAAGITFLMGSCSSNKESGNESTQNESPNLMKEAETTKGDVNGIGKFKNVQLTHPLDAGMVEKGQSIFTTKCFTCHKLTDEKLVGPGWKGVTDRQTPEWILNFITNTEEMLDKDTDAKNLYEVCLVKMPNQGLKDDEARAVYEFMRKNDGKK